MEWTPHSDKIVLNSKILLYYNWNVVDNSKLAFCNLFICNTQRKIQTYLDAYAVCKNNTETKSTFVVVKWGGSAGLMFNTIYNINKNFKTLCNWVEEYIFTKESITDIFNRLLHSDRHNIIGQNIITRYDAMHIIYKPDQLDNDMVE